MYLYILYAMFCFVSDAQPSKEHSSKYKKKIHCSKSPSARNLKPGEEATGMRELLVDCDFAVPFDRYTTGISFQKYSIKNIAPTATNRCRR